jgi:hypothetical protein
MVTLLLVHTETWNLPLVLSQVRTSQNKQPQAKHSTERKLPDSFMMWRLTAEQLQHTDLEFLSQRVRLLLGRILKSGTVALSCEDANNIKTATDITGSSANAFVEGASTGAASAFVRGIGAACEITATVATATQDAGKLVGWVEYVVEN